MSATKTVTRHRKLANGSARTYTYTYSSIKGKSIQEANREYKNKQRAKPNDQHTRQQTQQNHKKSSKKDKTSCSPKYLRIPDDTKWKIIQYHQVGLSLPKIAKATQASKYAVLLLIHDTAEIKRLQSLFSANAE